MAFHRGMVLVFLRLFSYTMDSLRLQIGLTATFLVVLQPDEITNLYLPITLFPAKTSNPMKHH